MTSLLEKFRHLWDTFLEGPDPQPKNSYSSVREFLLEIFRISSVTLKSGGLALIIIALPIAIYLTASPSSPLRQSSAATTPPPTPTQLPIPSPFRSASPSATPRQPLK